MSRRRAEKRRARAPMLYRLCCRLSALSTTALTIFRMSCTTTHCSRQCCWHRTVQCMARLVRGRSRRRRPCDRQRLCCGNAEVCRQRLHSAAQHLLHRVASLPQSDPSEKPCSSVSNTEHQAQTPRIRQVLQQNSSSTSEVCRFAPGRRLGTGTRRRRTPSACPPPGRTR